MKDRNMILLTLTMSMLILAATTGGIYYKNSMKKSDDNATLENISINKTGNVTNDSSDTSTKKQSKTSGKSSGSKSSYYGVGSSAVDSNGYTKSPPDDSGNWVIQGGKWQHATTYKNGHYYDYHGDIVDHKMR